MSDRAYWLALHRAPRLGARGLSGLLRRFPNPRGLFDASPSTWAELDLAEDTRRYLGAPDWPAVEADLRWLEAPGHHLLMLGHAGYPARLAETPDPPPLLFVAGDPEVLTQPQLALVGSRNATPGGSQTAFDFARYLATSGLVITSGLANGVDGRGHAGALEAGGLSVAVAGTGLDRVYPARHQVLARRIAEEGAIVSELPLGSPPRAGNFPRRNRIISGLSLGVLVVEAARSSGSLITARLAAEQGREVFAVPGSIHNPLARGCHQLIRQGAKLVETASDILEELGPLLGASVVPVSQAPETTAAPGVGEALDDEYAMLLEAMGYDPVSVDVLVERTGLTAGAVSSMLLLLELQGQVGSPAGGLYARVS